MRKELEELLNGVDSKEFLLSEIIGKGAAIILQELLEQKLTDFLERALRDKKEKDPGYRNGYKTFNIKTSEGKICVF